MHSSVGACGGGSNSMDVVWLTCGGHRLTLDAIPQEPSTSFALNTSNTLGYLIRKP